MRIRRFEPHAPIQEKFIRPDRDNYFLDIAEVVASMSTCIRRCYGAVIVKNGKIKSTGYNGACKGEQHCNDSGICKRKALGIKPGERYELCVAVHAEANAVQSANPDDCIGATLYLVGINFESGEYATDGPCLMCQRTIINSEIEKVILRVSETEYKIIEVKKGF